MKQVALGPLTVSQVAFGCMSLQAGDTHAPRLLQQALDQGITFFDTADLYDRGENEELLRKSATNGAPTAAGGTGIPAKNTS